MSAPVSPVPPPFWDFISRAIGPQPHSRAAVHVPAAGDVARFAADESTAPVRSATGFARVAWGRGGWLPPPPLAFWQGQGGDDASGFCGPGAVAGCWVSRRGAFGAPRPRPRAVDRLLGSPSQRMTPSACSPPPPSSSPFFMPPPLVAASLGNYPPAFIVDQVPLQVGIGPPTRGKGPRESSGGAMGRGGGPRCLALQFCLPACLMSFPSYVPSRLRDFPPAANAVAGGALEVVSTSLTRGARHPAADARGGHGGGLAASLVGPPSPPTRSVVS